MSTATATNGDSVRIPGWLWTGGVLAGFGATLLGVAVWVLAQISACTTTNVQQETRLVSHEWRIGSAEKVMERIEAKLDRILERLDERGGK